jgi:muramoyltetrapeptide carboxypeptidase
MPPSEKISRRAFAGLAAGAVLLPSAARPAGRSQRPPPTLLKPPRLRAGDTIGLVAPGGRIDDQAIAYAVARVEALGFKARLARNLRAVHGGYAGAVQQRVDDLHAMFAEREVGAIWCMRGGSGCISLLAHLDYALIRAHPKILLGYSDISALQLAILKQARLVTFHGPVAMSGPSDYALEHMLAVLMHPQAHYTIPMAQENSRRALLEPHFAVRTVTEGQASGRLVGGNLSLVSALMGTPYAADFRKAILFLEEVNEAPYRIDRWLTQLDLALGLRNAAALMVGICDRCGPEDAEPSLTLDETLDLHLKPLTIPAVSGYSFGHIRHQFTLPLGIMARLDSARQTLTLLEPAVR